MQAACCQYEHPVVAARQPVTQLAGTALDAARYSPLLIVRLLPPLLLLQ